MSASVAPTSDSPAEPRTMRRGEAPFPTPIVRRAPGLRVLLGSLPLGGVPLTFLLGFVTVMTWVPGCAGEDITHSTPVTGVQLLQGTVSDPASTPPEIQQSVSQAPPYAYTVLIAALATLALALLLRRFAPTIAVAGGGIVIIALLALEGTLTDDRARVDVSADRGFVLAFLAALLAVIAGLCLHRWRKREAEPFAGCAGFWLRATAFTIDALIVGLVTLPLVPEEPSGRVTWLFVGTAFLYWTLMECSPLRATLGKQALGLVVTDSQGRRLSIWAAAGRQVLRILSFVTVIGVMLAGWNARRQALHDLVLGTLVVCSVEPPLPTLERGVSPVSGGSDNSSIGDDQPDAV
jgi:uncharacterized RDD family membrane protein YckC